MQAKSIVVIKGSSIGDIITGIPMLRNLRKSFPESRIMLACSYRGKGISIVKNCPYLNECVILDYKTDGMMETAGKLAYLRSQKPDLVINGFPTTIKSSILALLIGGKLKAGLKSRKKHMVPFFFDEVVDSAGKNAVEAEDEILRRLGINHGDTRLELFLDMKTAGKSAESKLKKCGIANDRIIGFYFGKNVDICRSWKNGKWAELIDRLNGRYKARFVFIGGNDGILRGRYIENLCKTGVCNLIGKLDLEETAVIIKRCGVFVTINAGPMQIAAAAGTPLVALHGSSLPEWYPHSKNAINLRNGKICEYPCGNDTYCTKCKGRSIKDIAVEDVFRAVGTLLRS